MICYDYKQQNFFTKYLISILSFIHLGAFLRNKELLTAKNTFKLIYIFILVQAMKSLGWADIVVIHTPPAELNV